jgi:hypothetical protein
MEHDSCIVHVKVFKGPGGVLAVEESIYDTGNAERGDTRGNVEGS